MPATSRDAYQAPAGTRDVIPPESARWQALIATFAGITGRAGYGLVQGPVFEDVGVFQKVGTSTDVVRKEMYDFEDKGGRHLVLRPEGTAGVVRTFVQHRPTTPWKVWYAAPNFRYERPQAGRYRQHHQLGVEALGTDDPDLDVEVISLAADLYAAVGLRRVELALNSLGDARCRPAYREALSAHLAGRSGNLCDEHRERWSENPLRVLDCKRPACVAATADAPRTVDHLCDECGEAFDRVQSGLAALGIPFTIEPRLVRGLDYYGRTTFEFAATALDSAQNGIGGGGRYDGLAELLGGPPTPGIGFGTGIERILLACDAEEAFPAPGAGVDVFVVDVTGGDAARDLTAELRRAGIAADRAFGGRSMKAQMKLADRSGAPIALLVGESELADGTVTLRQMAEGGGQASVPRDEVVAGVRVALVEVSL
ncbi:MAG: histidine--tRNA ligase [Acidimicrobiales bacterium]